MSRFRRDLPLQSATLRFAQDKVGLGESEGENWGPLVSFCLRLSGLNEPAPWCAAFVRAMSEEGAAVKNVWTPLRNVELPALVQSYFRWAEASGRIVEDRSNIGVGDLILFETGRTDRKYDHMGFVAPGDAPDGHTRTVEANTAPEVSAGSARDRDGEVVAEKVRSLTAMNPVIVAWGRDS